ncbi:Protein EMP47 [Nakaseomyces bracarensis]|uniref:Protein EMP47 n=1 Tax=Nakaseomyces bracarensis TaxID=273131 RepID=A0ABR4NLT2_9SACH
MKVSVVGLLAAIGSVYAHGAGHAAKTDNDKLDVKHSLPDLVKQNDKLPSNWVLGEAAKLEAARFVLTPGKSTKGSLWAKDSFQLEDSFAVEWTFRDVGYEGESVGGMAFWMISGKDEKEIQETLKDKSFVNGPAKFDGLLLYLDTKELYGPSIKAQLNDKSLTITRDDAQSKSFGSCLLGYQDSSVPTTLRLTYDRDSKSMLKLQIDNRICFQTFKVSLPAGMYRFGATAVNDENGESFEVLKMKLYNGIIEDSLIPNVNAMPQPKFVTKQVDKATGKEKIVEQDIFDTTKGDKVSLLDLYKKLDKVEGELLANDMSAMEEKLSAIVQLQKETTDTIVQLLSIIDAIAIKRKDTHADNKNDKSAEVLEQYKDFISMNEKLEQMLQEQQKVRDLNKHEDTGKHDVDALFRKMALWLSPVIVLMLIMSYYTFKIRQEIVKTKLL